MSTAKWQNMEGSKKFYTKGQLISKCLFGVFNSPEKRTKKNLT